MASDTKVLVDDLDPLLRGLAPCGWRGLHHETANCCARARTPSQTIWQSSAMVLSATRYMTGGPASAPSNQTAGSQAGQVLRNIRPGDAGQMRQLPDGKLPALLEGAEEAKTGGIAQEGEPAGRLLQQAVRHHAREHISMYLRNQGRRNRPRSRRGSSRVHLVDPRVNPGWALLPLPRECAALGRGHHPPAAVAQPFVSREHGQPAEDANVLWLPDGIGARGIAHSGAEGGVDVGTSIGRDARSPA